MAATETTIRRMYYTVAPLFTLLAVFLVLTSDRFGSSWSTTVIILIVLEFSVIAILLAIYLWVLVKRLNEISHLNFITEK